MSIAKSFLDPLVIARLLGIPLDANKPMAGNVSGRHRSATRGSSLEFAQYRKYVPGDDTRRLDWRVWGRSDRCYVKEFEADTNLRLCLVLDTSGSMGFGPNGTTDPALQKISYARKLAGTLGWLATKQGDAVGLVTAGAIAQHIPARRGARHLRAVLDRLDSIDAHGDTGIVDALHAVAERMPRRSLIVIVSDFFVEPSALAECLQHLRYRKHDVAIFHLLDTSEVDFTFDQPIKFLDLEGGSPVLADPSIIGNAYRESVRGYMHELDETVRQAQVDYRRTRLSESYGDVLARFLHSRRTRSRK
jgi:uncharacterized protein (DUF58 family)